MESGPGGLSRVNCMFMMDAICRSYLMLQKTRLPSRRHEGKMNLCETVAGLNINDVTSLVNLQFRWELAAF